MKKIIFRLDDICPDMNYDKFERIRDLFLKYNVKPLIGLIPNNEDEKLKFERTKGSNVDDNFIWEELLVLQNESGWDVALHGYKHEYVTKDGGILNINNQSEFAGVNFDEQLSKIKKGKDIIEKRGFKIKCFMAPAHSFDENTIKAIKKSEIEIITDGVGVYPYDIYEDVIAFPVPATIFRNFPVGIYTICLHPNTMREKDFVRIENLIIKNRSKCITFSEAVEIVNRRGLQKKWRLINKGLELYMRIVSKSIALIAKGLLKIGKK